MNVAETLTSAVRGLTANVLRTALTTLGILIGVAAVIVLLAVGNGSKQKVQSSIEQLGTNTVTILSGGVRRGASTATQTSNQSLTVPIARELADSANAPHVKSVTPEVSGSVTTAVNGTSHSTEVTGTYPSYFEASNSPVGEGTYFTNADISSHARVAVIGTTVETDLFGAVSAVGKTITMGSQTFTVVGVLKAKGSSGFNDPNDVVIAPLPTVQAYLTGYGPLSSIVLEATDSKSVTLAEEEATSILNAALHIANPADASYQIQNQAQLLATRTSTSDTFTVLLASVAGISLLVGGIGVMNIMLVTVTERTREIGIRKALGATRSAILAQFLTEAALLSLGGGLFGVIAGIVGSQFEITGVEPVIVPLSIPLALGVSIVIGVFFGGYPASRAAALRPIQALRYE